MPHRSRQSTRLRVLRLLSRRAIGWPAASHPVLRSRECEPAAVQRLQRELGVSGPLAQVLVRRGLAEPARARAFIAADEEHPLHRVRGHRHGDRDDPRTRARLATRITVHGDYDVDGVCSTAVLVRALRRLRGGCRLVPARPRERRVRAEHGHGRAAGGTGHEAARDRGLRDHGCRGGRSGVGAGHGSGRQRPPQRARGRRAAGRADRASGVCGYPVCRDCARRRSPTSWLEGLLGRRAGCRTSTWWRWRRSPMSCRCWARTARWCGAVCARLPGTAKPGLRALMAVARVDPARVNERSVAFALAPRLNAAGRLYRADAGLELILTEDPMRAAQIAQELDRINHERRSTRADDLLRGRSTDRGAGG